MKKKKEHEANKFLKKKIHIHAIELDAMKWQIRHCKFKK